MKVFISDNGNAYWKCESDACDSVIYLSQMAFRTRKKAAAEYCRRTQHYDPETEIIGVSLNIFELFHKEDK